MSFQGVSELALKERLRTFAYSLTLHLRPCFWSLYQKHFHLVCLSVNYLLHNSTMSCSRIGISICSRIGNHELLRQACHQQVQSMLGLHD